jgi:hypothetical protein
MRGPVLPGWWRTRGTPLWRCQSWEAACAEPGAGGYIWATVFLRDVRGNLALQVGVVSDERAKYCSVRLRPLSDCTANHRPVLSSERAPHRNKNAT